MSQPTVETYKRTISKLGSEKRQLYTALEGLLECLACDNPDAPEKDRTYYCLGLVSEAIAEAERTLTSIDYHAL